MVAEAVRELPSLCGNESFSSGHGFIRAASARDDLASYYTDSSADHALRQLAVSRAYGIIAATLRFGTKPTGISATSFIDAMSMAETVLLMELET